ASGTRTGTRCTSTTRSRGWGTRRTPSVPSTRRARIAPIPTGRCCAPSRGRRRGRCASWSEAPVSSVRVARVVRVAGRRRRQRGGEGPAPGEDVVGRGDGGGEAFLVRAGHEDVGKAAFFELLLEAPRHPRPDGLTVAPAVLLERHALRRGDDPQVVRGALVHGLHLRRRGPQVPLVPEDG